MNLYRKDFPIFEREIFPGKKLIYLDSSATSQKPNQVIDVMSDYYRGYNANIHRGIYTIAEEATVAYEIARGKVASFIDAASPKEIVYTRNATESINLVANTWGKANLHKGDTVILTEMEHHANLVPWQLLKDSIGIRLEFIPVLDNGTLDLTVYKRLLDLKPKLVGFVHMSNVLGTINPAAQIIELAHQAGALALIDCAQSVPHLRVSVKELNPDFLAFSGHKMCGPTGIGILYAREALLQSMPVFMGGGDMIRKVELTGFVPNEIPYKFEAGTPAIAEAIGLGAAIDYLEKVGFENIEAIETDLTRYAFQRLKEIPSFKVLGDETNVRGGVISMYTDLAHPHDIAQILDLQGVAVRAGHHCAMPLHTRFQLNSTTRASFYLYNMREDIDILIAGLQEVVRLFG